MKMGRNWLIVALILGLLLGGALGCTGSAALGRGDPTPTAVPTATPRAAGPEVEKAPERGSKELSLRVGRGWLGLSLEAAEQGVRVAAVTPDSPAEKGGVKEGDVIMWVDGNRVRQPDDVVRAVAEVEVGEEMILTVRRGRQELDVRVTVGERPSAGLRLLPDEKSSLEEWLRQLPLLEGVKSEEVFKHFVKAQLALVDKDGHEVVLTAIAGRVKAVSQDSLTIEPNGPGVSPGPYRLADSTVVQTGSRKGSVRDLRVGDKVVVVAKEGSTEAVSVVKVIGDGLSLRLPRPSSIPGWDKLREKLRELGIPELPEIIVPDPSRDYGFKLK